MGGPVGPRPDPGRGGRAKPKKEVPLTAEARTAIREKRAYPDTPSGRRKAARDTPLGMKLKRAARRTFTLPSRTLRKVARAGMQRKVNRQSGRR